MPIFKKVFKLSQNYSSKKVHKFFNKKFKTNDCIKRTVFFDNYKSYLKFTVIEKSTKILIWTDYILIYESEN